MDVDCHPCASKQEQIVKIACGEQGLGRAVARSRRSRWCKGRSGVRGRTAPERRTVKLRYFASSCEKVSTKNSICGSRLATVRLSRSTVSCRPGGGTAELRCGVRRPILSCINKACAKGGRRAWHGGCFAREQCMWTHVCRRSHRSATRNPQLGGGRGLGGIPAEGRPHEQHALFGRCQCACTGLAGGPWRPPSLPHWTQQDFSKSVKSPCCLSPSCLSPRVVFHCHRVVRTPFIGALGGAVGFSIKLQMQKTKTLLT